MKLRFYQPDSDAGENVIGPVTGVKVGEGVMDEVGVTEGVPE
jgi:hypothetical protein